MLLLVSHCDILGSFVLMLSSRVCDLVSVLFDILMHGDGVLRNQLDVSGLCPLLSIFLDPAFCTFDISIHGGGVLRD